VRYRTAAILSIVLVAAVFGFQYAMRATANRYAEQTLDIPGYLRVLFHIALFVQIYHWLLVPLVVMAPFIIAAFTSDRR
jgi:uncharacterized membrane protein